MPARKMRVEVYDDSGNRYTISLEGRVTRKNAIRILDIIELLGGMPQVIPESESLNELSKFDKVRFIVEKHFPLTWFTARDFKEVYEKEVQERLSLSTVSTYLSRLSQKGLLLKTRNSNRVSYRLISNDLKNMFRNL